MNYNRLNKFIEPMNPTRVDDSTSDSIVDSWTPMFDRAGRLIATAIRKQPVAGVSIGIAIGVIIGCLVKRRR